MPVVMRWVLEDHLCRGCGGRILKCVSGQGPSPGGNPLFKCADCGKATTSMGPDSLCWCGFTHRHNHHMAVYQCVPFSILNALPEKAQALTNSFRACGCEPGRGEVGIMLEKEYRDALRATAGKPEVRK